MVTKAQAVNVLSRTNLYEIVQARDEELVVDKMEKYIDKVCRLFNRSRLYDCSECPVPSEYKPVNGSMCKTEFYMLRMLSGTMMENKTMFDEGRTGLLSIINDMEW